MSGLEIIILSVALAIDAMLVSFSYGLVLTQKKFYNSLKLSFAFGLFQFLMPVSGCYLSALLYSKLEIFSKWIVFIVFMVLGLKFLKSAFEQKEENLKTSCISALCLLVLALATSIDAMGAGVSFKFLNVEPFVPSAIIGFITFVLSFFGFWVANFFRELPSKPIEITGAILLMYLAIKAIL